MLQPNQFEVNEAWIAFRLNDAPLRTEADGDFDFFALMDAASCFILASATVSTTAGPPTDEEAAQLLDEASAHGQALPKTLFLPEDLAAQWLADEAQAQGITVVDVPIDQLLLFIGEARQSFRERFGGGAES